MEPGSKLDIAVAKAIGWTNINGIEGFDINQTQSIVLDFSTSMNAAMVAFEWLEQHHPWGSRIQIALCREFYSKEPSVLIWEIGELGEVEAERSITGDTYPHAICLAILDSAKKPKVT